MDHGIQKCKTRPSLESFGVPSDLKAFFKVVSLGDCLWGVVARRTTRQYQREVVRQKSGKLMREGKYGRKTIRIKNRVLARLDRDLHPDKEVANAREALEMSLTDAWETFGK